MFHLVARTRQRSPMFRTWAEARALWDRVVAASPGLVALVLMPDHLHLLHPQDVRLPLAAGLSSYTQWRNGQRDESGSLFEKLPPAEALVDADKRRRSLRYVALNPCRARLVDDPLAWPFSTHRDAVGLAVRPVVRAASDPIAHHAYVSADPSTKVAGTALPSASGRIPRPEEVAHAVSALTRVPMSALWVRGPERVLYLCSARVLCDATHAEIAVHARCREVTVRRAAARMDEDVRRVERVVHDARFWGLLDGDLPRRWLGGRG